MTLNKRRDNKQIIITEELKQKKKADLRTDFDYGSNFDLAGKERLSIDKCFAEESVPPNDRYIFQRVLGHQEIQNGHKWCLRDICWICEGWSYALFLWSP